jgi:hypothetical protein
MVAVNSSIDALRRFLRDPVIPSDQMGKHLRELVGKNDRLVAIVAGSFVEASLRRLLEGQMRNGTHGELFGARGPLSGFAAKIEIAYALRLIDANTRRNAHYIREIRNVFAHKVAPVSFRTPVVAAVCKLLSAGSREGHPASANMRTRYLFAATATASAVWGRDSLPPPLPPSSQKTRDARSRRKSPSPHPR